MRSIPIEGLFGGGVYLADRPDKVDQYCTPDHGKTPELTGLHRRIYRGFRGGHDINDIYVFICRVTLGYAAFRKDANPQESAVWSSIPE